MSRGDQVVLRSCFVTSGINELYSYQIVNFKAVWHYLLICGELISEPVFFKRYFFNLNTIGALSKAFDKIQSMFSFLSYGQQMRNYIVRTAVPETIYAPFSVNTPRLHIHFEC